MLQKNREEVLKNIDENQIKTEVAETRAETQGSIELRKRDAKDLHGHYDLPKKNVRYRTRVERKKRKTKDEEGKNDINNQSSLEFKG